MHAKWTRSLRSLFIYLGSLCILMLLVFYALDVVKIPNKSKSTRERKLVLIWNRYFSKTGCWMPTTKELNCPISECDVTANRALLNRSSAIILHWYNINPANLPECDSLRTGLCPLWVLFNREPPYKTERHRLKGVRDNFHLTATYRKDSDIETKYGHFLRRKSHKPANVPVHKPEKQLVCWLVSNCKTSSRREIYVHQLKKYIDVHIYGKCGTYKCPYRKMRDCYNWLSNNCTFYLSFENAKCRDYVTEKLYYAMEYGMIPIVMGDPHNYAHLPNMSYIHVDHFPSPKELADYLITVKKNKSLYSLHHEWRRDYYVELYGYKWFCQLCEILHSNEVQSLKPHKNLMSWWYGQSGCNDE